MVDRSRLADLARAHSGQNLDSSIDRIDRIDVKLSALDRTRGFRLEHQVRHIGGRHQHALRPAEADRFAHAVKAFDFFVHSANRLHLAILIDRSGDRQILPQWRLGQRRQ